MKMCGECQGTYELLYKKSYASMLIPKDPFIIIFNSLPSYFQMEAMEQDKSL